MVNIEEILLNNGCEEAKFLTNHAYDGAFIGTTSDGKAVYDYEKMIEGLMVADGITYDEAKEWVDYNILPISSNMDDKGIAIIDTL